MRYFGHISLDSSSDLGMHVKGWERLPVVWCSGISEMFGDVWDRGGVKMDVKKCLLEDAFGKETLTKNGSGNALKYQLFVYMGCGRNSVGGISTCWFYV